MLQRLALFVQNGKQRLSRVWMVVLAVVVAFSCTMLILTLINIFIWLTFLTALSYLKVLSGPCKYIPQVTEQWGSATSCFVQSLS